MNLSRPVALFDALTSNAPANFGNVRISLTIVCFVLFPVSQGLACSWDLNGVGYPAECGYRGRGGGGGAPQPYVPSAAKRSDDINTAGVQASNAGNWALAASLFEQALQINPSSTVAAINLRNTRAIIVSEDGIKAFNARNWGLAESLFARASQINPNNPAIANNLLKVRAIIQGLADQRATEEQNNAARDLVNSQALAEAEAKRKAAIDLINGQVLAEAEARRKAATDLINSAAATTPGGNTRRGTMGESVPDNPDIGPAEGTTKTTYSSASAQAAAAALDPNCVYDGRPGCVQGTSLQFPKADSPSAAINALAYSIAKNERARNDPVIKNSYAWYLSLDKQVKEKQAQITEIQQQIDSGGDQKILNMKIIALGNDVQRSKTDQKAAMNQIKDQAKKLNLSLDFPDEAPPSPPPAANATPGETGGLVRSKQ